MNPILIISLSRRYGGADVRVFEMASALDGDYPYGVVTLKNSILHKNLVKAGLNVLPVSFSRGDPRLAFSIYRIIKRGAFEIIDMHNPQSHLWGIIASKMASLPSTITTVHNSRDLTAPFYKNLLYEKVMQLNSRLNSRFIAVSQSVFNYLLELNVKPERISLISSGIAFPESFSNYHNLTLRQSFGWGSDHYVVIVVGRLEPVKGHAYLVEALKSVVSVHTQIRCLFVGDGREREALKLQVKEFYLEKYVHFAGFREDIRSLLAASDAFCMPSLSEGLPYALLEAGACRLPLLVTAVGGMAEFLQDDETAIMVRPKDPKALSEGLLKLIDHPQKSKDLGLAASEMVRHNFSIEKMTSKTLAVYAGVIR